MRRPPASVPWANHNRSFQQLHPVACHRMQDSMKTEIISIGSELTSGQNLDTNSQWLCQRLAAMGIVVGWHSTIADDLSDNVEAFRIATRRAGLVLATCGLGPKQD